MRNERRFSSGEETRTYASTDRRDPLPRMTKARPHICTFRQMSKRWMDVCEMRNKKSTYIKYKNLLETYILPELGDFKLREMDTCLIVSFLKKQFLHGGSKRNGLSSSTVKSQQHVINSILQYAAREKYMDKLDFHVDFLASQSSKVDVLSERDERLLVEFLLQNTDRYKLGILICLYTGIRIGELCALSWKDVNFQESYIAINHTVQRLQTEGSRTKTKLFLNLPKSKSSVRIIPIPDFLVNAMERFREKDEEEYLILSGSDQLTDPRTMQYKFSVYLELLEIERVNFHTLRHTFATRCVRIGFDIKTLSEILGHSNVKITLNRYVHPSMEMKVKQMQLVHSEWFGKMMGSS